MSSVLSRDNGNPRVRGSSQARAFTCTTTSGGKNPGSTRAGTLLKAGEALVEEALAPEGNDFPTGTESVGDFIVGQAIGCKQDHPGPLDQKIR
jgi:hypothetical protein